MVQGSKNFVRPIAELKPEFRADRMVDFGANGGELHRAIEK
jgi:hypothetical protein